MDVRSECHRLVQRNQNEGSGRGACADDCWPCQLPARGSSLLFEGDCRGGALQIRPLSDSASCMSSYWSQPPGAAHLLVRFGPEATGCGPLEPTPQRRPASRGRRAACLYGRADVLRKCACICVVPTTCGCLDIWLVSIPSARAGVDGEEPKFRSIRTGIVGKDRECPRWWWCLAAAFVKVSH